MTDETAEHWDERYRERERIWSGRANAALVRYVTDLTPGTVLDLGCGEGADAVWLARQGWRVTAVDVSQVALDRAAAHAAEAGVADRIGWQRHDLAESFPAGSYDLVSAQFLHSRIAFPRERVLRAAAGAVAPGGRLLVVGHAAPPPWSQHHHDAEKHDAEEHDDAEMFPTAAEVYAALDVPPDGWHPDLLDAVTRDTTGPDGQPATLTDTILLARRLASP